MSTCRVSDDIIILSAIPVYLLIDQIFLEIGLDSVSSIWKSQATLFLSICPVLC